MRRTVLACALVLIADPAAAQDTATVLASQPLMSAGRPKSVTTARLLGIGPGLGHLYAGEFSPALAFGLGTYAALAINSIGADDICPSPPPEDASSGGRECGRTKPISTVTLVVLAALVGSSIYDAGRAAERWNVRHGHRASVMIIPGIAPSHAVSGRWRMNVGVRMPLR